MLPRTNRETRWIEPKTKVFNKRPRMSSEKHRNLKTERTRWTRENSKFQPK